MKKNKTYYSENNQEDEDVYTLYPSSAIIYKDAKRKDEIDYSNDALNSGPSSTQMTLSRIIETQTDQPPLLTEQIHTDK